MPEINERWSPIRAQACKKMAKVAPTTAPTEHAKNIRVVLGVPEQVHSTWTATLNSAPKEGRKKDASSAHLAALEHFIKYTLCLCRRHAAVFAFDALEPFFAHLVNLSVVRVHVPSSQHFLGNLHHLREVVRRVCDPALPYVQSALT
jgi:hypothetical protein